MSQFEVVKPIISLSVCYKNLLSYQLLTIQVSNNSQSERGRNVTLNCKCISKFCLMENSRRYKGKFKCCLALNPKIILLL